MRVNFKRSMTEPDEKQNGSDSSDHADAAGWYTA